MLEPLSRVLAWLGGAVTPPEPLIVLLNDTLSGAKPLAILSGDSPENPKASTFAGLQWRNFPLLPHRANGGTERETGPGYGVTPPLPTRGLVTTPNQSGSGSYWHEWEQHKRSG